MDIPTNARSWDTSFLDPSQKSPAPLALIVLNQSFAAATLSRLWLKCRWRIFADGGSNRVHDAFGEQERLCYRPNHIKGDLDSLRQDVRIWYERQGVSIEEDHDHYSTDLMKCLNWVGNVEKRENIRLDVVILGGLSGRLDHTIHTMSHLHQLRNTRPRIFVVGEDSVGWVLNKGDHHIDLDLRFVGPTCGLLPVGIPSTVLTTTGLKWNLDNTLSSFDGLVSTSNVVVPLLVDKRRAIVTVSTSEPVWWCVEHPKESEQEESQH